MKQPVTGGQTSVPSLMTINDYDGKYNEDYDDDDDKDDSDNNDNHNDDDDAQV